LTKGNRKRPATAAPNSGPVFRSVRRKKPVKTPRARRVVKRQTAPQASAGYLFLVLLVVAIVSAGFVYHLRIRFEGVELGYKTSQARAERARLLVERRELRLELASLKSAKRVEAEAREKLGMDMPGHDKIIPIGQGKRTILASGRAR